MIVQFIHVFQSILEVNFEIWLNMLIGIYLNFSICMGDTFVDIFKFFIWFTMELEFEALLAIPEQFQVKVRERVYCDF